jgi:hypothetical protein
LMVDQASTPFDDIAKCPILISVRHRSSKMIMVSKVIPEKTDPGGDAEAHVITSICSFV